jgi:hypothetical protein
MAADISYSKDTDILSVSFEVRLKKLTSAEQVILECKWTDFLQNVVESGNKAILRNFQYRLEMEDT